MVSTVISDALKQWINVYHDSSTAADKGLYRTGKPTTHILDYREEESTNKILHFFLTMSQEKKCQ